MAPSERFAFGSGLPADKDDVIRVVTGDGGGMGDRRERDPRGKSRTDMRNGLITRERAAEVYGVVAEQVLLSGIRARRRIRETEMLLPNRMERAYDRVTA